MGVESQKIYISSQICILISGEVPPVDRAITFQSSFHSIPRVSPEEQLLPVWGKGIQPRWV